MHFRTLLNLVLGVLLLGLSIYLITAPPPLQDVTPARISTTDPASVRHILISRPGKADLRLDRRGQAWMLTAPPDLAAHPARVRSVLALLHASSPVRLAAASSSLARLGLDPPAAILLLNEERFEFGGINPMDNGRYLRHGQSVYVIDDSLYPQLLQDPGFFVNPRILAEGETPIRIQYPSFELAYRHGRWDQPAGDSTLDPESMREIADAWAGLEAARVIVPAASRPLTAEILLDTPSGLHVGLAVTRLTDMELVLSRVEPRVDYLFAADTAARLLLPAPR
jgi:hypothetical protein